MRVFASLLLGVMALVAQGCCSPSSDVGAATARKLSQAELRSLYEQMEQYKGEYVAWGEPFSPLPEEFAKVGALYGDVGRLDRLVLGGCMDDKASLFFDGLHGNGQRQILLLPGERMEQEVLWRDSSSALGEE